MFTVKSSGKIIRGEGPLFGGGGVNNLRVLNEKSGCIERKEG